MKIGIFDSGIGGLCVLHKAMQVLPQAEYIYYADVDNVPYGTKPRTVILEFCKGIMDYMVTQNVDAVVVACNTATSVAIKDLRSMYSFPIIGMEPAVKKAREEHPVGRTLVMATPVTVQGDKLKYLLERVDQNHLVDLLPMPDFVGFAENDAIDSLEVEKYIIDRLAPLKLEEYSSLVLGCTHFNYFKPVLRKILPDRVCFVDGIEGTVAQLSRQLSNISLVDTPSDCKVSYFFSGRKATDEQLAFINRLLSRLDAADLIK